MEKTLIFCAAFVPSSEAAPGITPGITYDSWDVRYRIWLEAIRRSTLSYDQILFIDDGSPQMPAWEDLHLLTEGDALASTAPVVLYHFAEGLGSDEARAERALSFAARYAQANGFTRIVHIAAASFLISEAAIQAVNHAPDGRTTFWNSRHGRPETAIQILSGEALDRPVTETEPRIATGLAGGGYGEDQLNWVPRSADWCLAARPTRLGDYASYFWWMPWFAEVFPHLGQVAGSAPLRHGPPDLLFHTGRYYLDLIPFFERTVSPPVYFEIGTNTGASLKTVTCDAVCVDPAFRITTDVLLEREITQFFQMESDRFFARTDLVQRALPTGIGLAFLDGLHLFENLLKDFINAERISNPGTVILLHDCLPFNLRMAERAVRKGGEEEPEVTRGFWTGDVWKLLLVLQKYRPELLVLYLDCPPTGLVSCTHLDRRNTVLQDSYEEILAEFGPLSLEDYGFERLWSLFPTVNTHVLLSGQYEESGRIESPMPRAAPPVAETLAPEPSPELIV